MIQTLFLILAPVLASAPQQPGPGARAPQGPSEATIAPAAGERIGWFVSIDDARLEAERSGRPIFLLAAQPHCREVPGAW